MRWRTAEQFSTLIPSEPLDVWRLSRHFPSHDELCQLLVVSWLSKKTPEHTLLGGNAVDSKEP